MKSVKQIATSAETQTPATAMNADTAEILMVIGQARGIDLIAKLAGGVNLKLIAEIKESKKYKGLPYTDQNGKPATVATFEEFCPLFLGRSYRSVAEDLQNREAFGDQFMQVSQRVGLTTSDLRQLRKLPDEEVLQVQERAVNLSDKEQIRELIEELVNAHQITKRQMGDIKADLAREQTWRESLEIDNERLHEQARAREINNWPAYVIELRLESSALADKAFLCVDDLERLMARLEQPELSPDDPQRFACFNAAAMAFWTNLRAVQARVERLARAAAEVLKDCLDESPEALPLMPDAEIVRLADRRELMVGEHKSEALARQVRLMETQPKRRGRPKGGKGGKGK